MLLRRVANPALLALIQGAGFTSLDGFAQVVNHRGWEMYGVRLRYDHIAVKRWLAGGVCQYPDVVAAVLDQAWGIPVPPQVIWPERREGGGAVAAHLQPWVAQRTLEELAAFIGSDMLTRRESLSGAVRVATGAAFVEPLARWLGMPAQGLGTGVPGPARVGLSEVVAIERATRQFATTGAQAGGGLSREAAVGQLKFAVDLARHGSYGPAVGDRLLAAVGELSGVVGWLCHDSGMPGPAQRYLTYGLQAARESGHERAPLLAVAILADLARHQRYSGHHRTSLKMWDLALDQLPADRTRFNAVRAVLWGGKAWELAMQGSGHIPEARNALNLAADLLAQADEEDRLTATQLIHSADPSPGDADSEVASFASWTYIALAEQDRRWATEAEARTRHGLAITAEGIGLNRMFRRLMLARARFALAEPEQGARDVEQVLGAAEGTASASERLRVRLGELMTVTEPYQKVSPVRAVRDRIWQALRRDKG